MRPWLLPARRARSERASEATLPQIVATGAAGGTYGDTVDDERGWKPAGSRGREVPYWTLEKARIFSVAGYRMNPMARAIIDTYVAFAVGDSGVSLEVTNPKVRQVVEEFWEDPATNSAGTQELGLRSQMLMGETVRRVAVGSLSGVVRYAPMDPQVICEVLDKDNNPARPEALGFRYADGTEDILTVVSPDDVTGLRDGECLFWTPYKTLETDQRSMPFLTPVLDWLDAYDTVLSNLIDRTALARYLAFHVTLEGADDTYIKNWVTERGGLHVPRSGTIEVSNEKVKWEPKTAETGAYEDSKAASSVLTLVAGGAGLAKTWLAEPEDANRATSLSMAEPVRRRVQAVQKMWVGYQTEQCRFVVDRAVAAKRLTPTVQAQDPKTGEPYQVSAARAVRVTGPEIAAADASITAQVLLNLATGLEKLVQTGALTREAAQVAAQKAWEDFVGVPYRADLGKPDANPDDVAQVVDDATTTKSNLRAV